MSEELLPCPFCGSCQTNLCSSSEEPDYSPADGKQFMVCCDYRHGGCGSSSGYQSSQEEAIKAWNTRPDSKPYKYETVDMAWDNNERTPSNCDYVGFVAGFNYARERKGR